MAEKFQCKAYKDYHELLANTEIEAVSIVLPDNMHRDCVEEAVKYKNTFYSKNHLQKNWKTAKQCMNWPKTTTKCSQLVFTQIWSSF